MGGCQGFIFHFYWQLAINGAFSDEWMFIVFVVYIRASKILILIMTTTNGPSL